MTTPPVLSATPRWITVPERVPPLRSRPQALAVLAFTTLSYVALTACAAAGTGVGAIVATVAIVLGEYLLVTRAEVVVWAMGRVQFGPAARGLIAGALLVLLAARESLAVTIVTAVVAVLVAAAAALATGAAQVADLLGTPAAMARGLDVPPVAVPTLPALLLARPGELTVAPLALAGVGVGIASSGPHAVGVTGAVVALVLALVAPALLGLHVLRLRRGRVRQRVVEAVQAGLDALGPQVAAYYGQDASWRYMLEMWLPTLEQIEQPTVIVVRDADTFAALAPTDVPVICAQRFTIFSGLQMPHLRAALYVGNAALNIQFMRRPSVTSAFIGHGDSDKPASANPMTRMYSEIWVAGPAGRDRYRAAGLDIPDHAFVEVGRPQLGAVPRTPDAEPRLTVLYAPTWEGWGEDDTHSSLARCGPALVAALLAHPDVRVMYRPHPRSGHRDKAMRAAHLDVLELLRAAGAREHTVPVPTGGPHQSVAEKRADIERWTEQYWQAHPGHRILTPPAPDVAACFCMTDVLIADISSLVTDFLAADRPYAVVKPGGTTDEHFRATTPSVRGGFLLDDTLGGLDALLAAARTGDDPTAGARREATGYLLGPRTADPTQTFRAQLDRLCR